MGSLALLQSLKESVLGQANVKAIYGEPISAHEKTIIPVAKIMYGYGAERAPEAWAIPAPEAKAVVVVVEYGLFP